MDKKELYELYKTDFVDELINMYQEREITTWKEIMGYVCEYSDESGEDYDDVIELVNREMDRKHI